MSDAVGMVETMGFTGLVEATDAMCKAANATCCRVAPWADS